MAWMCTKCFQEFNGYGNTCNDCIRKEQLEEQNRLIRKQNELIEDQQIREKYRNIYQNIYRNINDNDTFDDENFKRRQKIALNNVRNDVLGQIAGYFILYLLDKIFLNGFVFGIIWDVLVIGYEVIALFVGVLFDIFI